MKSRPLEMSMLFDFYGEMLTEKQKEFFDLYYNEDLSLSEISENAGITRQGVRDAIVRAENILRDMEDRLSLVRRYGRVAQGLLKISDSVSHISLINDGRYRNEDIASEIKAISLILSDIIK